MKNLFDYATSELSQDAFLCWLFENYNCDESDLSKIAVALLSEMTGIKGLSCDTILDLKTFRQEKHTDIIVCFEHQKKKHTLVIEDKIFSDVRNNQFEDYPKKIESVNKFSESVFHYVIYKTDRWIPTESAVRDRKPWKSFYLPEIYSFFEKFSETNCQIVEQYWKHIRDTYEKTASVSEKPMIEWKGDRLLFRTYIVQELIPYAKAVFTQQKDSKVFLWGRHYYPSLGNIVYLNGFRFSLEIIFRPDCDRAETVIRLSNELKTDSERTSDTDRKLFWKELLKQEDLFRKKNNKWCIASGSREINERLRYENGKDTVTDACKNLINTFADVCKKIQKNLTGEKTL